MCETSSMVGKCRAISTTRCLRASGKLSSRASSTRKPPTQRRALVRSCGIVIAHPATYRAVTTCLWAVSQIANARDPYSTGCQWLQTTTARAGELPASHICDGAPAIAIQSAAATASQRLLLTITNLHRPSLKDAHSSPMSRSSCASRSLLSDGCYWTTQLRV